MSIEVKYKEPKERPISSVVVNPKSGREGYITLSTHHPGECVYMNFCSHVNRHDARELARHLEKFANTGEL